MKTIQSILFASVAATALFSGSVLAEVSISNPWVRATVPAQKATGAFMQLKSDSDVKLVAASAPATLAGVVEVHEMSMNNGVMKMQPVAGGLALPAKQAVELKPGSYHIMLMELKQQVKAGETVTLTLTFEDAKKQRSTQTVKAEVRELTSTPHHHH